MQKFFDQAISGNWSYNPQQYEGAEVPTSVMAQDLLTTYKYGWKTSYYQNTYDNKSDDVESTTSVESNDGDKLKCLVDDIMSSEEEVCESCAI